MAMKIKMKRVTSKATLIERKKPHRKPLEQTLKDRANQFAIDYLKSKTAIGLEAIMEQPRK